MKRDQDQAIISFFKAVSELQKTGVSRSSRYLGDIGEFLCTQVYSDLVLHEKLREPGHDALLGNKKVQIKFHNSPTRTNIDIGDPQKYEILLLVIGPESRLKEDGHLPSEFRVYQYGKKTIMGWGMKTKRYYCAKGGIKESDLMKIIKLSEAVLFNVSC